jgi:hypothetical protein
LPAIWKKIVNWIRSRSEPDENIAQIKVWIYSQPLARVDQGCMDRSGAQSAFATNLQPIFSTNRNGAYGVLN